MIDKKIFAVFEANLKKAEKYRKPIEREWNTLTDYYHLKTDEAKTPKRRFTALLADYADSIRARWIAGLFSGRDWFGVRGREGQDDENAEAVQAYLKYQLENELDVTTKLKKMLIGLSYLGTRVMQVFWDVETDRPILNFLSNDDYYPDPEADSIEGCKFIITKEYIKFGRLLDLQAQGILQDVDAILKSATDKKSGDNSGSDDIAKARNVPVSEIERKESEVKEYEDNDKDKDILIYQMWTDSQMIMIDKASMHILTKPPHRNPFGQRKTHKKPFVLFRPLPEEGFHYGLSPVRKLISKQEELNEVRFQRIKFIDLYIRGIWLLKRGAVDKQKLIKEAMVEADDITESVVKRIAIGGEIIKVIDNEEANITKYADKHTGIYDPQRGGGEGQVTKTASGLSLIVQEGNMLFQEQIANIATDGLKPLLEQILLLNRDNVTAEKIVRVTGRQEPLTVTPDLFNSEMDIEITSAPGLGMQEQKQKAMTELKTIYGNPQAPDPTIDQQKLTKEHIKSYGVEPEKIMLNQEVIDQTAQLRQENDVLKRQLLTLASPVEGRNEA